MRKGKGEGKHGLEEKAVVKEGCIVTCKEGQCRTRV